MDYEKLHKDTIAKLQDMVNSGKITSEIAREICADFIPESEDERIRKEILSLIQYTKGRRIGYEPRIHQDKMIAWLERQCEQKPADKKGMNLVEEEMTPFQKEVFCIIDTAIEEEQGLKQVCDKLFALASNEIKQKSAWNERDKEMSRFIGNAITADDASTYLKDKGIEVIDAHVWLDELKDRVQPQPNQEWSEEDNINYKRLLYFLDGGNLMQDHKIELSIWLKSLKDRYTWKPSDEQLYWIKWVAYRLPNTEKSNKAKAVLEELLGQLMKLREE